MAIKYYNYQTDKDVYLSKHFQLWEFATYSDYYGNYPSSVPVDDGIPAILEKIFDHFDCSKGEISSGYRTPECNSRVGGSPTSLHLKGMAVDVQFRYKDGTIIPSRIISCYLQDIDIKGIGLNCGGSEEWTHFDMRTGSTWYGDEKDYSCGHSNYYSYTGTNKSEVYPNGTETKPSNQNESNMVSNSLKLSDKMLEIIKTYEGFSAKAIKLTGENYYTIGYGHCGVDVKEGQTITQNEALELLRSDVKIFENAVNSAVKVSMTQNQFDALVSLAYNIGIGAVASSDTVKHMNNGEIGHATVDIPSWRRGMGYQILPGLEKRRQTELEFFATGQDFTITDSMNVRSGPGTNYPVKTVSQLSENGRKCAQNESPTANAIFKPDTEITALEVKAVYSSSRVDVWFRCPSGWICARMGDEVFVN